MYVCIKVMLDYMEKSKPAQKYLLILSFILTDAMYALSLLISLRAPFISLLYLCCSLCRSAISRDKLELLLPVKLEKEMRIIKRPDAIQTPPMSIIRYNKRLLLVLFLNKMNAFLYLFVWTPLNFILIFIMSNRKYYFSFSNL